MDYQLQKDTNQTAEDWQTVLSRIADGNPAAYMDSGESGVYRCTVSLD